MTKTLELLSPKPTEEKESYYFSHKQHKHTRVKENHYKDSMSSNTGHMPSISGRLHLAKSDG